MQTIASDRDNQRTAVLFAESDEQIHLRTDRMFAWLMVFQWLISHARSDPHAPADPLGRFYRQRQTQPKHQASSVRPSCCDISQTATWHIGIR